jgi:putative phosphoribosyl transferase
VTASVRDGPAFVDRRAAGRQLAAALAYLRDSRPLLLALPRGGVPVGYEVAVALGAELDLLIVRKLGAPGHEEFAIGAVIDGAVPQHVLNAAAVRATGASADYVRQELDRQLAEIERRRRAYLGNRRPPAVAGRTVIVVDDGIATGATMTTALRAIRKAGPARLVLAVPVAPADVVPRLRAECDEVVCLTTPDPFFAVGVHYGDFRQTGDSEVIDLLASARRPSPNSAVAAGDAEFP